MKHLSTLLAAVALSASSALAQSAATRPAGALSYTIARAGAGGAPTVTSISVPLSASVPNTFVGASSGVVASVSSVSATQNLLTVTGAAWDPVQFTNRVTPYFVRIMSGASAGRTLLVPTAANASNTATTVVVDVQNVSLVGSLAAGDKFEFIVGDTIQSMFGDYLAQLVKGATASVADNILVLVGTQWLVYFHDNTRWRLDGAPDPLDNRYGEVILRPDSGFLFRRRAGTDLVVTELGSVPSTDIRVVVNNRGLTYVGNPFPVLQPLSGMSVQLTPGWISGAAVTNGNTSDRVQALVGTQWLSYYHDSTDARWEISGNPFTANLPLVRPLMFNRLNTNPTGRSVVRFPLPYTL